MSRLYSRFLQLQLWLVLLVGFAPSAHAAGWFDDFNDGSATDGNPVTWIENLGLSNNNPPFPGDYNASSGDYVLTPAPDPADDNIMSSFVDESFTDVYMRTQGIVLPDPNNPANVGGNLVLTARFDIATLSGYLVYFDVSGNLVLQLFIGGEGTDIAGFDAPFNAGSEVVVELNIVGEELSAFAWLADDPNGKPDEPQVTTLDFTFASGVSGIAFAEDDDGTAGVFRYAAAQDTPFVDAVAGDFNGDGKVDAADYVVWRKGAQSQDDYNTWRMNFGVGTGAGSLVGSAVPEPVALIQLVVAVAACLASAVRRRSVLA
ncbi:MAG TPA: hypothetical protein VGK58_09700 [Lacipirellulaceae bacterium]